MSAVSFSFASIRLATRGDTAPRDRRTTVSPIAMKRLAFPFAAVAVALAAPALSAQTVQGSFVDPATVEVYRGASETPPEYRTAFSACGVVLIWMKK